jgi:hypothetical protein
MASPNPATNRRRICSNRRRNLGCLGLGRARHRSGQGGKLPAQGPGLVQFADQPGKVPGLFSQRQGALRLAVGIPAGLRPGKPLMRFDPRQIAAALVKLHLAGAQPGVGLFGAALQLAAPFDFGAHPGSAPGNFGQHRFQHRAQVHGLVKRAGTQQRQNRRAARQALQGRGQLHERALTLCQLRSQQVLLFADQAQMRRADGDFGFGLLDAGGKGGDFGSGAIGRGGGAVRIGFQRFGAAAGNIALQLGLGQRTAGFASRFIGQRL